jgi:hypothetical protein
MDYSCTLKGRCEIDLNGIYPDQVTCEANCHPYEGDIPDDVMYDILALNLEDALDLAPSDIVIILFRVTGIRANKSYARDLLTYVIDNNYVKLWFWGEITREYTLSLLEDELDTLILDVVYQTDVQPDWTATRNKVSRLLKGLFQERLDNVILDDLEDGDIHSIDHLVLILQRVIAEGIYRIVSPVGNIEGLVAYDGVEKHWDYIVETFGPVIPYQRYIN